MSTILDLAKSFEAASTEQAKSIDETVKREQQRLLSAYRAALQESEQILLDDIRDRNQRLRRKLLSNWGYLVATCLMLCLASAGALLWSGNRIADNLAEISKQKDMISRLQSQGGSITLSNCEGRLCVAVDPNSDKFRGEDGTTYMIAGGY